MEKEGFVSLFLGNTNSYQELENYVLNEYTEDGDVSPSKFEKDFNIDYYDEDFREIEFYDKPSNDLTILLQGSSYKESIVPGIIKISGNQINQ